MDRQFGSFVWDLDKEAANVRKHAVDFPAAALAFDDPRRRIFVDQTHSIEEERFYCLGEVGGRVLTVRFTYREGLIRIYGAAYWRKGRAEYETQNG